MSLRFFLIFIVLIPVQAYGSANYKNSDFEIKLNSDWTRTVLIGVDHLYFESQSRNVSLKIETFHLTVKPDNFVSMARKLIDSGIKNEIRDNKTVSITIKDETVSPLKTGMKATYSGRDSTKRSFKMIGFIQENKVIYLYFETPTQNERQLESVIDEVLFGFIY